ncbi:HEPN domain-containing protein [Nocardia xishanensis]|uniref:HEPN domain-containing protein n=1 Tax=Nocardia xishanensis TaxID=238964 RepID=UPI0033FAB66B
MITFDDAEDSNVISGRFWRSGTPERSTRGVLYMHTDQPIELALEQPIIEERAVRRRWHPGGSYSVTVTGDAESAVADFEPQTFHGRTANGLKVTVLEAQGGSRGLRPSYQARYLLSGAHVNGEAQQYHSTRFQISGPNWWCSQAENTNESASVAGGGTFWSRQENDGRWFEYASLRPLTLDEIDIGILTPCVALTALTTAQPAELGHQKVQLSAAGEWLNLYAHRRPAEQRGAPLMHTVVLNSATFAHWITQARPLDGLDTAVTDSLDHVAVQTQVLTMASIAEGLHRRLYPNHQKRIPTLTNSRCKRICDRARTTITESLDTPGFSDEDRRALNNALSETLSHLNDQSFATRLVDLSTEAEALVPGIVEPFADWPKSAVYARNALAHQDEKRVQLAGDFFDLLVALSISLPWVLRTVLLSRAGIDRDVIRSAYADSSQYRYHLANVRRFLQGTSARRDDSHLADDL